MTYSFHPAAQEEFFNAVEYYEERESGLGIRFAAEVYATLQNICDFPNTWELLDSKTRRCFTSKFPFGILYRIVDEEIKILAVMHLSRKPGYWKKRR